VNVSNVGEVRRGKAEEGKIGIRAQRRKSPNRRESF